MHFRVTGEPKIVECAEQMSQIANRPWGESARWRKTQGANKPGGELSKTQISQEANRQRGERARYLLRLNSNHFTYMHKIRTIILI